jgi:hypothetical protein
MKRGQVTILIVMSAIVILLFCIVGAFGFSLMAAEPDAPAAGATQVAGGLPLASTATPTSSPIPTSTPTNTPTETPIPTPTATLVVNETSTATATRTPRPTRTLVPTSTPVPASGGGGGGGGGGGSGGSPTGPTPTPGPTSRYPLHVIAGPVEYTTKNFFVTVLAQITVNNAGYLAGYKMVGFHSPTGFRWEGVPSCNHLCKASGPDAIYDEEGKEIETFLIQEGNAVYEFPFYEDGQLTFWVEDPQGNQASEVIVLPLDRGSDDRRWFYMHFNR